MNMPSGRQIIAVIIIAFILYAIFTQPDSSAATTGDIWNAIKHGLHQIGQFFGALLSH